MPKHYILLDFFGFPTTQNMHSLTLTHFAYVFIIVNIKIGWAYIHFKYINLKAIVNAQDSHALARFSVFAHAIKFDIVW